MPVDSNNPFGIKARKNEPSVTASTTEHIKEKDVNVDQNSRKFDFLNQAFDAHAELLADRAPYAVAKTQLPDPKIR